MSVGLCICNYQTQMQGLCSLYATVQWSQNFQHLNFLSIFEASVQNFVLWEPNQSHGYHLDAFFNQNCVPLFHPFFTPFYQQHCEQVIDELVQARRAKKARNRKSSLLDHHDQIAQYKNPMTGILVQGSPLYKIGSRREL